MSAALIGRPPERLTLQEQWQLAGKWIALPLYDPATLPLRVIMAVGDTATACMQSMRQQGLDPSQYEYLPIPTPYELR